MNIEFSFILYIDNQKYVTCSSSINWITGLYLEKGNVEERGELVEYLEDNHLEDVAPLVLCLGPWQLVLGEPRGQPAVHLGSIFFSNIIFLQ